MHVKIDLLETPFDDMQLSLGGKARRLSCRSTTGSASSLAALQLPSFQDPDFPSQLLPIAARWNDCLSEFCVTPSSPPWTAREPASDYCIAGAHLRHSFLHETRQADGSGSNVHRCSTLMKFL